MTNLILDKREQENYGNVIRRIDGGVSLPVQIPHVPM